MEGDQIEEVCEGKPQGDSAKAVVMKGFINAHTHVGDSFAYPAPKIGVEALVGPPDGHKHKLLRTTSAERKLDAMRRSVDLMRRTGTCAFIDFREEGLEGVSLLKRTVSSGSPKPWILGRPSSIIAEDSEIDRLISSCDGIGMSAIRDWPPDLARRLSERAHALHRIFAFHASETVRECIDSIIALRPDFVVHMTCAQEDDIAKLANAKIPVVVCPRANEFFGLTPDIPKLLKHGVTVALGTDNCMINHPDMMEEMKAAYRVSKLKGGISPLDAVVLAVYGGRKILKEEGNISKEVDVKDDLVAIRVSGEDPLRELVSSARSEDIIGLARGGKVWRSETG